MEPVTRRSFLATGSASAAGVASAAAFGPVLATTGRDWGDWWGKDDDDRGRRDLDAAVVSVLDARRGEVELLVGSKSIVFKDRDLVARLARASR
jgi:hypothetical protein